MLVDDRIEDAALTIMALKAVGFHNDVELHTDGRHALKILEENVNEGYGPHIVFLDVNMPAITGCSMLLQMRRDHKFNHITVVMLTTADYESKRCNCYEHGADFFLKKHADIDDFTDEIAGFKRFWDAIGRNKYADLENERDRLTG
ncbi:response regulator [Magnetospirillum sp. LM-5]|uniref:response regulator n=1 Tax=Magnetospirillum sp. LM-5 TaxID=2681466 RepID=UPI00156DDF0C|nr:response regulator [Magnetospirillum sp. LM-5]